MMPVGFHRRLPSYTATPLHDLTDLAQELGLGAILVKDESDRLGLPAFKVLGASWAVYRKAREMLGGEPEPWSTVEELSHLLIPLRPLTLVAATDGNHGRSVARVAAWLGFGAWIFVPEGTVARRIEAIESEGAEVTVVDGSYDDAVKEAAARQGERSVLIQDTGWPGYETIPRWVIEGYATMFREIDVQMAEMGRRGPHLVVVQIGVGSLAAATVLHCGRGTIVGVEPHGAACAKRSLERGEAVTVPGPHRSMMAGLNCGTLSSVAWPILKDGLDACISVSDDRAAEAMRILAAKGIESGESGAAGLAGLLELVREPRPGLALNGATTVLLLSTEGITDEDNYRRICEKIDREV
jgi:diaminopropionate ammonia-lyase